jgi:nitrate reductase delta subunit
MNEEPPRRARERASTPRPGREATEAPAGARLPAARWVPARGAAAPDDAGVVLRAASALLDHPAVSGADLAGLAEHLALSTDMAGHASLLRFLQWWARIDARERERRYVETFDEDPGVSLFLSGGRPDASREQAERLVQSWRSPPGGAGVLRRAELSDYLPLLLQVAARLPAARAALVEERPALEVLAAALLQRRSPFADVVAAVLAVLPPA